MSRLIGLYPAPWRARYEAELRALLEERPPTFRDLADLALGALDARLHPELLEPASASVEMAPEGRAGGIASIAGGLAWLLILAVVLTSPRGNDGPDVTALFWITLFLMTIGLIGPVPPARARQIRQGVALGAVLLVVGLALPWELKAFPVIPLAVLIGSGLLAVATLRAGLSSGWRLLVVGLGFVAPFVVAAAGSMGLIDAGPADALVQGLVMSPYGLAWVLCGSLMVRRGRHARPDSSALTPPTEALAA